jgi:hypothetical protein
MYREIAVQSIDWQWHAGFIVNLAASLITDGEPEVSQIFHQGSS